MHDFRLHGSMSCVAVCLLGLLASCLAGCLTGCGGGSDVDREAFSPQRPTVGVTDAPAADVIEFTTGVTQFGFDLYRQLESKPGNLVLSPYGVHSSLAVLTCGMNEAAKIKTRKALRTEMADERFEGAASTVIYYLFKSRFGSDEFHVGNALWLRKDLKFQSNFMKKASSSFGEQTFACDFAGDNDQAIEDINAWMRQQSSGQVQQVVSKESVTPDTVIASTNVVLFQADLDKAFEESETKSVEFAISESQKAKVPTMHRAGRMRYSESDDWQVVGLTYSFDTYRMNILLPKKRHGLAAAVAKLDIKELDALTRSTEQRDVRLWLPRFSFESRFTLTESLKAMALKDLFVPTTDVFTQLVEQKNVRIGLSSIVTTARVEVTEKGVKAGSGSATTGAKDGPPRDRPVIDPVKVRCDHPFLFVIYHNETNAVLFMGRVANPS